MCARQDFEARPRLLLVAGMPASGKSTLARRLSERLGMPILEKDDLKEALFDTLGFRSYAEKRALDAAANATLLCAAGAMLDGGSSVIVVNNFRRDMEAEVQTFLSLHACRAVLLLVTGDAEVLYERYTERERSGVRHLGHALQDHYPPREGEEIRKTDMTRERFAEVFEALGMADFRVDCPCVTVDMTEPDTVELDGLTARLRELLKFGKETEA